MTEYSQRRNLFLKECTYTLSPRGVEWTDVAGERGHLDFADVERAELKFIPTRYQRNLYRTTLRGRAKQKLELTNTSYEGFAVFENCSATYVPFVRELHAALAAANPAVRYTRGMSRLGYVFTVAACLIGTIALLGVAAYSLRSAEWGLLLAALALILVAILRMWTYVAKNRPGDYDPRELPEELLPKVRT